MKECTLFLFGLVKPRSHVIHHWFKHGSVSACKCAKTCLLLTFRKDTYNVECSLSHVSWCVCVHILSNCEVWDWSGVCPGCFHVGVTCCSGADVAAVRGYPVVFMVRQGEVSCTDLLWSACCLWFDVVTVRVCPQTNGRCCSCVALWPSAELCRMTCFRHQESLKCWHYNIQVMSLFKAGANPTPAYELWV